MKKPFSKVLKQIMSDYKITQTEFARKIGVGQSTISRYLAGTQIPGYDVLQNISSAFNISGDEVLGLD